MKTEYSVWFCDANKNLNDLTKDLNQNYNAGYELVTSYLRDNGKNVVFIFKKK